MGDFSLRVDQSSQFYAFLVKQLKEFDLEKDLSTAISTAAKPVVADMRKAVRGVQSSARFEGFSANTRSPRRGRGGSGARARSDFAVRGATRNAATAVETGEKLLTKKTWDKRRLQARSLRDSVAKGVRLVNRKTGDQAGVMIRSSATYLPPDQKALPRAMNRGKWRHPFFGNREFWVEQTVRPRGWFSETAKASRPSFEKAVTKAVDDAVMELAKRGRQ